MSHTAPTATATPLTGPGTARRIEMSLLQSYTLDVTKRFEHAFGDTATAAGSQATGDSEALEQPLVEKALPGRGFKEFDTTLRARARELIDNSKHRKVSRQMDSAKGVILENIDQILQRNTSIDHIVRSTDELHTASATFKDNSTSLKRHMQWQNIKSKLMIAGCGAVLLLVILMWACDPNFKKC